MRITPSVLTALLSASCLAGLATSAMAWDPNAGAENTPAPTGRYAPSAQRSYAPPPHSIAPLPMTAATSAPAPAAAADRPAMISPLPNVAAAPAPVVIAPPPVRQVPPEQPFANTAPVYYATPAPTYAPPAPIVMAAAPAVPVGATSYVAPVNTNYNYGQQYYDQKNGYTFKRNQYSLGVEGYWDRYREPIADLESNSGYGALDGSWTHYYDKLWFHRVELRGGYGKENYSSASGTIDGIDQWEFDGRLLGGVDVPLGQGTRIKPYIGLDMRYYRDEAKGEVTDLGYYGYDRRIFQTMLPIGVTLDIPTASGYHFLPTFEGGPLLFGNVSTRLGNIPGYDNLENKQHSGYELRGDLMVNNVNQQGRGWEFGPFVRYTHFKDSGTDTIPAGTFIEPENSRLQLGAKLGYLF